mgnify:CR=1 FL=1
MTETRLSFKEMCARFDVTPRTLRYYEYIELLAPEKEGRARFYGPREVARMKLILRGRRFGFSLEEIRQWLLIYGKKGERPQLEAWLQLADRQLRVRPDQPGRFLQVDGVHGGLERCLADVRVLDVVGLDLYLAVLAGARLRQERETQDDRRRVPAQLGRGAHRSGQPVLGEDRTPEIDDNGDHDDDGEGRGEPGQDFSHADIVAQWGPTGRWPGRWLPLQSDNPQVARYC